MSFIKIYILTLPRWFASPIVVFSILTGGVITNASLYPLVIACLVGLALMSYAHNWNSFHDFALTGFDKGPEGERSKSKFYTSAQSLLAQGILKPSAVLIASLVWLALALLLTLYLAVLTNSLLPFIPTALIALCAPWYSEAKLKFHPELVLGLGFATFATWLGMAASPGSVDWLRGLMVSLPIFVLFGIMCESVDQACDATVNWPKGLRNLGAWLKLKGMSYGAMVSLGYSATLLIQGMLIGWKQIPVATLLALLTAPLFFLSSNIIDKQFKKGVGLGLLAVFLYHLLYLLGFIL